MQLLHGDCLDLMKEIPDGAVDMILCDLPYGMTDCRWDSIIPFNELWAAYDRILKADGAAVLFAVQPFTTQLIQSNSKAFRYCWYWLKNQPTGFSYARYQPMRKVEDICVFYRKHGTYNPQGIMEVYGAKVKQRRATGRESMFRPYALQDKYTPRFTNWPKNVLQFNTERGLHPTQKPVSLLEYLVKTYTNPGETVLDNCMGSGSAGVAVQRVGDRHFIGIERDERYFEIARERIKKGGLTNDRENSKKG